MTSLEERKSALLNRWKELDHRLHDIEDTLEAPHSNDWEELAVEREGDEVLEGLGANGLAEIAQIRAALGRINDGEYGFCVQCGEEISSERLDAIPSAPLCRRCAGAGPTGKSTT